MIINYEEAKEPVGWVYQDESDKTTKRVLLILRYNSTFVRISTSGVGVVPTDSMKDPYGPHVIKRFYRGDTISFTVEEGDW